MDSFSFDSSDSSISYNHYYPPQPARTAPYGSNPHQKPALHSVRKTAPPAKPWRKPTAPLPPNPTRVYQVDRMNFRELVQQLTGASPAADDSHYSSRLHKVAPPPLDLAPAAAAAAQTEEQSTVLTPLTTLYNEIMSEPSNSGQKYSDVSLGLGLSPSTQGWCSIPMLSPGTLSLFEVL